MFDPTLLYNVSENAMTIRYAASAFSNVQKVTRTFILIAVLLSVMHSLSIIRVFIVFSLLFNTITLHIFTNFAIKIDISFLTCSKTQIVDLLQLAIPLK